MMKIIGITGGVGAGKSTVLKTIKKLLQSKCEIIVADELAKDLMEKGGILSESAIELFGDEVYTRDGELNKAVISKAIYSNETLLKKWNEVVHPAVNSEIRDIISRCGALGKDFVFIEAALLIENGYEKICDEIWYVYSTAQNRTKRIMTERGYSLEKAKEIMKNQLSDEEFRKYCSFVIDTNYDFENTRKQIQKKLSEYVNL